jgi:hypothetical protein
MRIVTIISVILGVQCSVFQANATAVAQTDTKIVAQDCPQVISCGTKDGKRKEYSDPCKAKEDGATNIEPKTGPSCDQVE